MSISFIECYAGTIFLPTIIVELEIYKKWLFSKILPFWFLVDILRIFGNLLEALTFSRHVRDSVGDSVERFRKVCVTCKYEKKFSFCFLTTCIVVPKAVKLDSNKKAPVQYPMRMDLLFSLADCRYT